MEGVGARLGRSSTRYGPATVFNGPVRRWKKKWVVHASSSSTNGNNHSHNGTATTYSNNASHLKLYKWTPISQSSNATIADKDDAAAAVAAPEEPPRRKFKYIPVAVLEEQKNEDAENEAAENVEEEEAKRTSEMESSLNRRAMEEKPDINDVPVEEDNEVDENIKSVRQDLNETTLDLSLGLEAIDGGSEPKSTR